MKRNRYIPFGYEIQNGAVTVNPAEADAVRLLYELYADGAGYNAIAARMTAEGIAYQEGTVWNKHMVKRILDNARYAGANGYPAIIDNTLLVRVAAVKTTNPYCKPLKRKTPDEPESGIFVISYIPSLAVHKLGNELNRALERNKGDLGQVRSLIFSCAAEKYASLIGVNLNG